MVHFFANVNSLKTKRENYLPINGRNPYRQYMILYIVSVLYSVISFWAVIYQIWNPFPQQETAWFLNYLNIKVPKFIVNQSFNTI